MPFEQMRAIEADNARLLAANDRLNATLARVTERRDELVAENVAHVERIALLEAKLANAERVGGQLLDDKERLQSLLAARDVTIEILRDRIASTQAGQQAA